MQNSSTIETVRIYEKDIEDTKVKIESINELLKEHIENMDEYAAVSEAQAVLDEAKAKLKQSLQSDGEYNNLLEDKGELAEKMRDQKEILSDHLVAYFAETKERQIELGNHGDAREVIISGKLGKKQKYQSSLFGGHNVEISDGKTTLKIEKGKLL